MYLTWARPSAGPCKVYANAYTYVCVYVYEYVSFWGPSKNEQKNKKLFVVDQVMYPATCRHVYGQRYRRGADKISQVSIKKKAGRLARRREGQHNILHEIWSDRVPGRHKEKQAG